MFARAVVVADQRPHALHDAVGGEVEEGLEFIVHAQRQYVRLPKGREDGVQRRDEDGGQGEVERRRHAHGIEPARHLSIRAEELAAHAHAQGTLFVGNEIDDERERLADARGQRRALDAHFREGADAVDHHRIEDDVGDAAAEHGDHRQPHAAHGLKELFIEHAKGNDRREGEGHRGVAHAQIDHGLRIAVQRQKARHEEDAACRQNQPVDQRERQPLRGGAVGAFQLVRTQMIGDHGVDADAEADGHGVDEVLDGKHQRERRERILADAGDKVAVDDVVERVDQHGDHHRQRHGDQQREHGPFLHKAVVHRSLLSVAGHKKATPSFA